MIRRARNWVVLLLLVAVRAIALPMRFPEGALEGAPTISDLAGHRLADGRMSQRIEGDHLFIRVDYEFLDGRRVEERAEFAVGTRLQQLAWSWEETRGGSMLRHFDVDFRAHRAFGIKTAPKAEQWSETLDFNPAETFAGVGFSFAIKNLHPRLAAGESVKLSAVAFTPSPRVAEVTLRREATESIRVQGRSVLADQIVIHPEVPFVARLFVHPPDQHLWFSHEEPPVLVRCESTFIEPGEPMVRIDPFGAAPSQARTPAAR